MSRLTENCRCVVLPDIAAEVTLVETGTPIFDALCAERFRRRWVLGAVGAIADMEAGRPSAFMPHYVWQPGTGRIMFNPGGAR